jgi:hypothetical protein
MRGVACLCRQLELTLLDAAVGVLLSLLSFFLSRESTDDRVSRTLRESGSGSGSGSVHALRSRRLSRRL